MSPIAETPVWAIVLVGTVWVLIVFGAAQLFYRYIVNYRLTPTAVLVLVFGIIPIMRLAYKDISEVRIVRVSDLWRQPLLMFGAVMAGNRFITRAGLVVCRENKLLNLVIITPDNPEEFAREIMSNKRESALKERPTLGYPT
jgi:hypothetical protein